MTSIFGAECPNCHTKNDSGANFCSGCGQRLPGADVVVSHQWARGTDDFATRIEVADVEGFFKKPLVVEAGTKAIFFSNGAYSGVVDAGKYDMGGLLHHINNVFSSKKTTALLVDAADVELALTLNDLLTRDPVRLSADCRVVLRLENPTGFFENLMKGRPSFPLPEVKSFLFDELHNSVQEFISAKSVHELSSNLAVKQQIEQAVSAHMAITLKRKGLALVQVRVLNFRHPRLNAVTNQMEEYWLSAEEMKAKAAGHEATAGLTRQVMNTETANSLMEVEVFEERAKVLERMRNAVASEKMSGVKSADQLEAFLLEMDKNRLVRQDVLESLKRDFAEKSEDHDLARKHLIQRLKVEQEAELQRAEVLGQLSLKRAVTDAQRADAMAQVDHDVAARRKQLLLKQEEEWAEIERDLKEAEAGIDLLRKMKSVKRDEADWDQQRQLGAARHQHDLEMERLGKLSTLSAEALIASAPSDRAAMLMELKRTDALKGFSEEQILALAAKDSPEVARAFQEKFKNASSAEVQKMYERMLAMQGESQKDTVRVMQDMFNRAVDTQRDTAVAAARSGQPRMTVVAPGFGPAGVVQAGGMRVLVCPKCRAESFEAGRQFCNNCGNKFVD